MWSHSSSSQASPVSRPRVEGDAVIIGKSTVLARRVVRSGCWEVEKHHPVALSRLLSMAYGKRISIGSDMVKLLEKAAAALPRNLREADQIISGLPEPLVEAEDRVQAANRLLKDGVSPYQLETALRGEQLGLRPAPAWAECLTLCDKGVVLGKGTVIVGLTDLPYGGTAFDIEGKEVDILALLSVARRGLAPAEMLAKLAAASRALIEGDISRAAIALAQTGQPALTDEALAKSLTFAANRLKRGVKPLELLKSVGMVNRNISALPWSKGAEGWNEDDHPREGDGAHYPSRFAPKNGGNQDAAAGQPSPSVDPDGTSGRYGDNTKLDTVEGQIKQAVQGKKYVALVGGAMDETSDGPVFKLWQETKKAHPDWDVEYFPNTDADGLKAWIESHPDSSDVAVIGHSYGGDTAAKVVAEGAKVGALITIDPVSHNTPDYDKVRQNSSDNWINVNANPDREQRGKEKDSGNLIAGLGGAWDLAPKGSSSQFYNANMNHSEVRRVLPGL